MDGVTTIETQSETKQALAAQYTTKTNPLDSVSEQFVKRVPIAYARRFGVLGLHTNNGVMTVALHDKASIHALDKISVLLGVATEPVYVEEEALKKAINTAYGHQETGVAAVIAEMSNGESMDILNSIQVSDDLLDSEKSAPVTKLVNLILLEAVKRRASDVHLQPYEDRLQVRLRIDGVLYDFVQPPYELLDEVVSRIKVMGRMNIAEKRLAQDGRTTVQVGDKVIDLRISTLPTHCGERVVLRLLDKSARLYRLPELGMGERELEGFDRLIQQSHGLVLVTGPTGSGKSTTLYAALQQLNTTAVNVLTLEDPIEYRLPGISQTQVSQKKGMTFATGLRTVLRQDPDVIMVGEIRDQETARMAIQSSLTGHLVFSTLHTNDAAGAVARLLDLGVEPYLVAGSLLGVLAQRLVRQVCLACRQVDRLSARDVTALELSPSHLGRAVYRAAGCESCHDTGYQDRRGIFELLTLNDEIHSLITTGAKTLQIKQAARRAGMRTLREDAIVKMLDGKTTVEEVARVTHGDGDEV